MSKRSLPQVVAPARVGSRTQAPPAALDRWNPSVRAAAEDDNSISILDVIGEDFWGEGVTARRIAAALRRINGPAVVNINSPGGDYFEGLAVYNLLREHPHEITVNVLGLAASAASIIAMAGDTVRIARAGFFMIHNAWVLAMGDRNELTEIAEWLEPFDGAAADVYAARSGIDREQIIGMMDRETWISGSKAVDDGFADEFLASDAAREAASARSDVPVTLRTLDSVLARAGMPRAERKRLLSNLAVTPGADGTGMPGAALESGVGDLLSTIKSIQ